MSDSAFVQYALGFQYIFDSNEGFGWISSDDEYVCLARAEIMTVNIGRAANYLDEIILELDQGVEIVD
ncbi:MAG: hypothetical protein WBB19_16375 [Desulforhopalus sp.]